MRNLLNGRLDQRLVNCMRFLYFHEVFAQFIIFSLIKCPFSEFIPMALSFFPDCSFIQICSFFFRRLTPIMPLFTLEATVIVGYNVLLQNLRSLVRITTQHFRV